MNIVELSPSRRGDYSTLFAESEANNCLSRIGQGIM